MTPARDALARVNETRRTLAWVYATRSVLLGAAIAALTFAGLRVAGAADGAEIGLGVPLALGIGLGLLFAGVIYRRTLVRVASNTAVALWIEERTPRLRYALVTAVGLDRPSEPLERVVAQADWREPLRRASLRAMRWPTAILAAALAVAISSGWLSSHARAASVAADRDGGATMSAATATPFARLRATVRQPPYARRPEAVLQDPSLVRALRGSRVTVHGSGSGESLVVWTDSVRIPVGLDSGNWRVEVTLGATATVLRLRHPSGERLIALEPVADTAPEVTLERPARDTVFREPRASIPLRATATDDVGLASGGFEYIVSSGEGESFTFKSGRIAPATFGDARQGTLSGILSLEGLALKAGDIVHLRAVARDANSVTGPGIGSSETRVLRIARSGEYDSIAVEAAAPPEEDKSVLSQRMLINLTEALVRRRRGIDRPTLVSESRKLARDQGRLRKQVGDIVFARLGDDASGEHFHGDGHAHGGDEVRPPVTPEEILKAAEAATAGVNVAQEAAQDETPIVAVNRPLLEAYNAMWDAGRELEQGEPARALPPMRRALAAIQRARNAERLYLRGRPPAVVVDIARVRLQGKDRGDPASRSPRPPLDADAAARLARFRAAVSRLPDDARAAADTLLLLRVSVLDRFPGAAVALEEAITALRAGSDATAALLGARRALEGGTVTTDSLSRWSGRW